MKYVEYLVAVQDATQARELLLLSDQARTDGELFPRQQAEVETAVRTRFCALNAATKPNRKGRWDRV